MTKSENIAMRLTMEAFLEKRRTSKPSYIIDLRDQDSFTAAHIRGAHNLPLEFLESNLHRLPFSGDLLFYDGGDGAVLTAHQFLDDNGFTEYFWVEEGFEQLQEALKNSPDEPKDHTSKDDPPEVQRQVIQHLLDFEINPMVASHGGFFSLIEVKDLNVYVELGGGCQGCGMVDVTLRQGVETRMREAFPDMVELIDVTDHDSGDNPYHQPGK